MRLWVLASCVLTGCSGPNVASDARQRIDAGVTVRIDAGQTIADDASVPPRDAGQVTPDAGTIGGLDCVDAIACAWQCATDDNSCITGCMSRVESSQSLALRQALICGNDNGCGNARCMQQNCSEAWALCSGEGPEPGDTLDCSEVLDCVRACEDGPCRQACIGRGAQADQAAARAVLRCGQTNSCNGNEACFTEFCADELALCTGEGPGPGPGDELDCPAYVECRLGCRDAPCAAACREQVAAQDRATVRRVDRCVQTNQCRDVDCILANCPEEALACGLQGGGGGQQDLSCAGVLQCVSDCANNQACARACRAQIRGESAGTLALLTDCMSENNCRNMRCAQRLCGAAYQVCNQDQ